MRYRTVLVDPPWPEVGGGRIKRGADRHYEVMKVVELGGLLEGIMDEVGSHLYLWVTNNYLREGMRVMEGWGYRYITVCTWAKDRMGIGQYRRGQTEQLLFGVRGKVPYKVGVDGRRKQATTLIGGRLLPRGRVHSEKPLEAREEIERVSFGDYLELFAREEVKEREEEGEVIRWTCIGRAVDGMDIRESLGRLRER